MGCLWCGKYNTQCKTIARIHSAFIPVTGLKCSFGKISSPFTDISVFPNEISGTKLARSLIWTHRKFTKYLKVRRDLGNQASPVNWAHVKRPWVYVFFTSSTTWVILSLMSFCVCFFLFGVHINYKAGIEIQGLPSSNCNFPGILRPWIFNGKFKDFQGTCEPWKFNTMCAEKQSDDQWRSFSFYTLHIASVWILHVVQH